MRKMVAALALTVSGCTYHAPTEPATTAPTIAANEPFSLTLGSSVGSGTTADHATITAKVQGPTGQPLAGIVVTFSTTVGRLDPEQVATDRNGISSTTLVASTAATVTAKAGTLSVRTGVGTQPAAQPPPTPTPTPAPGPNPGPTPTGPLNVTVTAADVIVGSTTILNASIQNGVPPYQLTWAFGDGATFTGSSTTSAHVYGAVGKYTVTVTVTDAAGRTAAANVTVNVLAAPPPPSPIQL
jgi:large repetitive protein